MQHLYPDCLMGVLGASPSPASFCPGTCTLRHSYVRHLLMNGRPINFVSRWLGHSSIQTTLIGLKNERLFEGTS